MSLSSTPLDAAAAMRWQRWQERGARQDARQARWRLGILAALGLVAGISLYLTIGASLAAR